MVNVNNSGGENIFTLLSMVAVMFLVLYLIVIRPRNKREKEVSQMRSKLKVGDIVTTVGGIVGIVVSIKDDCVTLETGNDRHKIRMKKWAIQSVEQIEKEENSNVKNGNNSEKN